MPAVVSGGSYSSTSNSPATISVTVGASGLLGFGCAHFRAANTVTSMTFDGSGMTPHETASAGTGTNGRSLDVRRVLPSVGTYDFVVTLNNVTQLVSGFVLIEDYDTGDPVRATAKTENTSGTTISTAVTSDTGDLVLDFATASSVSGSTPSPDASQSQLYSLQNAATSGGSSTKAGASGTTTMVWSTNVSDFANVGIAIAIKPAAGGGGDFQPAWARGSNVVIGIAA